VLQSFGLSAEPELSGHVGSAALAPSPASIGSPDGAAAPAMLAH
jgi:hypothetical protein